jgi:replicative DNA helicase
MTRQRPQAPPLTFSNGQAERALLGYYLANTGVEPTLQAEVLTLDPGLFQAHRPVLQALQTVVAAGDPVDLVTVSHVLRGTDQKMSMSIDLVDMMEQAAVTPDAHRRILAECLRRRRLDARLQHLQACSTRAPTSTP